MHLHDAHRDVHGAGPWFAAGMLTYLLIFLIIAALVIAGFFVWARTVGTSGPAPQAPGIQQPAPGGGVTPGQQQQPGGGAPPAGPQSPSGGGAAPSGPQPGGGVAPSAPEGPMQPVQPGGGGFPGY